MCRFGAIFRNIWIAYTHISHTNSGKKDNATPLFDWGKYYEKNGKIVMPVSVQGHHSFIDGIHIGQFADLLSEVYGGVLEEGAGLNRKFPQGRKLTVSERYATVDDRIV